MLKTAIQQRIDQLSDSSLVDLLIHLDPNQSEFVYRQGRLYQLTPVNHTEPLVKPDTCRDVLVTYKGEEVKGWWYSAKSCPGNSVGWRLYDEEGKHSLDIEGADIELVTSWREIASVVWQTGHSPLTHDVVGLFDGVEKVCWYKGSQRNNMYNIATPSRLPGEAASGADVVDPPSKWRELREGEYHDPKWSTAVPTPPNSKRDVLATLSTGEEVRAYYMEAYGKIWWYYPSGSVDITEARKNVDNVVTSWREVATTDE